MKEEIRVYSSNRPTMFLWIRTIYVSNAFLSVSSDMCLKSSYEHELGHISQRKTMFALVMVSLVIFLQLVLLLPTSLLLLWTPFTYLHFCFLCRLGEYKADEYALRHTDPSSMIEMLSGEGCRLDSKLAGCFYLLRWHPSVKRRLNNLGL